MEAMDRQVFFVDMGGGTQCAAVPAVCRRARSWCPSVRGVPNPPSGYVLSLTVIRLLLTLRGAEFESRRALPGAIRSIRRSSRDLEARYASNLLRDAPADTSLQTPLEMRRVYAVDAHSVRGSQCGRGC